MWHTFTQLEEPPFPVGVEERVRQVVAVVLGNLERLLADALVQFLRKEEEKKKKTIIEITNGKYGKTSHKNGMTAPQPK